MNAANKFNLKISELKVGEVLIGGSYTATVTNIKKEEAEVQYSTGPRITVNENELNEYFNTVLGF